MAIQSYKDISGLLRAIRAGEVPIRAVSPGGAANLLGVSRQAVFKAIDAGRLDCWRTVDGAVILVSVDSVNRMAHPSSHERKRQAA